MTSAASPARPPLSPKPVPVRALLATDSATRHLRRDADGQTAELGTLPDMGRKRTGRVVLVDFVGSTNTERAVLTVSDLQPLAFVFAWRAPTVVLLLDRVDLPITVDRPSRGDLLAISAGEPTASVAERVLGDRQVRRFPPWQEPR